MMARDDGQRGPRLAPEKERILFFLFLTNRALLGEMDCKENG